MGLPQAHQPIPRAQSRLASLDFLRGISILGVVAVHTAAAVPTGWAALNSALAAGRFGVQIFFLVSAYTMCHMWQKRAGEKAPVRKFYIRRFLRIAPLFWLVVAVYFVARRHVLSDSIGQLLLSLSFLHGFSPFAFNAIVPGGWSIAVEMTFYAFFPALIVIVGERRRLYLLLAIAIWLAYTLVVRPLILSQLADPVFALGAEQSREFVYLALPNQAPIFLLGCYLYHLHCSQQLPSRSETLLLGGWLTSSLITALIGGEGHLGFAALYIGLAVVVLAVLRAGVNLMPINQLGQHSYGMYLSHFLILDWLQAHLPCSSGLACLIPALGLTIALSLVMAMLIHQLIETRISSWTKALTLDR